MSRNIQTFVLLHKQVRPVLPGGDQGVFDDQALRAVLRPLLQGPSAEDLNLMGFWEPQKSPRRGRKKKGVNVKNNPFPFWNDHFLRF